MLPTICAVTALTWLLVAATGIAGLAATCTARDCTDRIQFAVRHDPVEKAGRLRLLRAELATGDDQFLGQGRPDLPHQAGDTAPRQGDTQVDLGNRETGAGGGDTQVAGRGQHQATAHTPALDARDGQRPHPLDGFGHESPEVRRLPDACIPGGREPVEVGARGKSATATADNNHSHFGLAVKPARRGGKLAQQLTGQRIEALRAFIMLPLGPPCFTAFAGATELIRCGSHMVDDQ